MTGNLKQAFLELGFAHLPCAAAELIKNSFRSFRPEAREQLDIFNWQEQPIIARIMNFKTIMRRTCSRNCLKTDEATNTVIDVNDDIASRKRSRFRNEILIALAAFGAAYKAIAQNILFGNDNQITCIEAAFNSQNRSRDLVTRQCLYSGKTIHRLDLFKAVLVQHLQETVERTFRPCSHQHFFASHAQIGDIFNRRFKQVHIGRSALFCKTATFMNVSMNNRAA